MTSDEINAHLLKENEEQKAVIAQLTETVIRLTANSEEQNALIQQQIELIRSLNKSIEDLKAQIKKLESRKTKIPITVQNRLPAMDSKKSR